MQDMTAEHIQLIGFRIIGQILPDCLTFTRKQCHIERVDHRQGDLVLDGEDITQLAVVYFREQVTLVVGVDKLSGDAHPVAGFPYAPFEDPFHIEQVSDLGNGYILVFE